MNRIGQSIENFRIVGKIAEELQIILYKVEQGETRAQIKELLPDPSGSDRPSLRFLKSAESLRRVKHGGIVPILGSGKLPNGSVYAILKPAEGRLLSDAMRKPEKLGTGGLAVLRDLAVALTAAHGEGVVYLGLRPDQVVLYQEGGTQGLHGQLQDCGLARDMKDQGAIMSTIDDRMLGSAMEHIYYMAPEHFSEPYEAGDRTDVYALGALSYHLLNGKHPCPGTRTGEVISAHLYQNPAPLRSLAPDVPEEVAQLIHLMLAKDPGKRPAMSQVAQDLMRLIPATVPQPEERIAAPLRFGDYEVVRKIGEGGMGEVFEAFNARSQRRAAIKIMRPEVAREPQLAERFLNEVRAANVVGHPGIVTILQVDQGPDGRPYIIMEYLDGTSLRARIEKGPLPVDVVISLGWQMALALATAHDKGIVHRDLKPENVMVVQDQTVPGGERSKIVDFGVAKLGADKAGLVVAAARTRAGVVLGTPMYMAPEQAQDASSADGKADVYALGVILYEMLAGTLPPQRSRPGSPCPDRLAQLIVDMQSADPGQRPTMWQVVGVLANPVPSRIPRGLLIGGGVLSVTALAAGIVFLVKGHPGTSRPVAPDLDQAPEDVSAPTKRPAPPGMVRFDGGEFAMGSTTLASRPLHPVRLSPFAIDVKEVTNEQFAAWLNGKKSYTVSSSKRLVEDPEHHLLVDLYQPGSGIEYRDGTFVVRAGFANKPMAQVTWYGADAYCHDQIRHVPDENQWEFAARGEKKRRYPWGDEEPRCDGTTFARVQGGTCAGQGEGPRDVGTSGQDRTPEGIFDLGGNVAEWVSTSAAPRDADPQDHSSAKRTLRVIRGGDWGRPAEACLGQSGTEVKPDQALPNVGFRCAKKL